MPKALSLIGRKIGRLIVVKRSANSKQGNSRWLCKCSCGKEKTILGYSLSNGHTKSCGCLHRESVKMVGLSNVKHGHKRRVGQSRTYSSWHNVIGRCTNPKHTAYKDYGGRGIIVCRKWKKSFENFLSDMGEAPIGCSIDRIDNNKGYCPTNCRWATGIEQQRNKRNNHLETYDGMTQCVTAWAEEFGLCPQRVVQRLSDNWPIERALTTPVRKWRKNNET